MMWFEHTSVDEDTRIAFVVPVRKALQHSVNLLCFLGQLNLHKQLAYSHIDGVAKEGKFAHITP